MIEKLSVDNFQCHKHADLEFVPGVNVITGTSDSGKSALLKALLWVITNRPQGMAFRNFSCEKGDAMHVTMKVNGHCIQRTRSETENSYAVNEQKFVAMRADVPSEVNEAHGMETVNIQQQFQPHFLLSATPKEVVRTLNSACDLSIIDRTVKIVNSIQHAAKTEANALELSLRELHTRRSSLEWAEEAHKRLIRTRTLYTKFEEQRKNVEYLESIFQELQTLDKPIFLLKERLEQLHDVDVVESAFSRLGALRERCQTLEEILTHLEVVETRIEAQPARIPEKRLQLLSKAVEDIKLGKSSCDSLQALISELRPVQRDLHAAEDTLALIERKLSEVWKACSVCPLCHQEIKR